MALRVPVIRGEPAHGLAARLAWRHGRDVSTFVAGCGLDARGLSVGHGVERLAELAGHDARELAAWTPTVDPPSRVVNLAGHRIALGDWSTSTRRWCGECLAEDVAEAIRRSEPACFHAHHRAWWDVRSIAACPRHGVSIRSACPCCGTRQTWRGRLDRCRCGASLLAPGEPLGRSGSGDAFLHGLLLGTTVTAPPFARGRYDEWAHLLVRLGSVGLRPRPPGRHAAPTAAEDRDRGTDMLHDWPEAFHRALDRPATVPSDGRGLMARYGWVYEGWIKDLPDLPFGSALREELRRHALGAEAMAVDERRLGHVPYVATVSATTAASLLGMGYANARRALGHASLVPPGVRRGVAFPIPRRRLEEAIKVRGRIMGGAELAGMLGTGRGQARRIAAAIGIPTYGGRYDRADISRRLARLRGRARPIAEASRELRALPIACRAVGVPLDVACAAATKGTLPVFVGGGTGIHALLVLPADLRSIAVTRGLGVEAAAARLGVHHQAVRALLQQGHLRRDPDGRGADRGDVDRFDSEFTPASRIADSLGTSPRGVVRRLGQAGLAPSIGPPACRATFFRRDLARRALSSPRTRAPSIRGPRSSTS